MALWDRVTKWGRQLVAAAMSSRPVPRHIGFIMDGNRRFAERRQLRKIEGHEYGSQKLIDALEWCLELGVECVSVYAFSIDNYKRSRQEVQLLMDLAEQKLDAMLQERDVLVRHGVQVRVFGDLSLAPLSVQRAAARIMDATRHHTRAVLNICFSYTASQEMLQALDRAALDVACGPGALCLSSSGSGEIGSFLDDLLYTRGCPPMDLLIRTSGETRLSDFLLWQCRHALLVFTPVLWPDFGFADLLAALVHYQRCKPELDRARQAAMAACASPARAQQLQQQQQQRQQQPNQWKQEDGGQQEDGGGLEPGQGPLRHRQQDTWEHGSAGALPQQQQQAPEGACPAARGMPAPAPCAALSEPAGAPAGVAVVKALHLGGESPLGASPRSIASPESPSSASAHSGDSAACTACTAACSPQQQQPEQEAQQQHSALLPPRWEGFALGLRRPDSSSSLGASGASPRGSSGGASNGWGLSGLRSLSSQRLGGSVDSFSSIDLTGDASRRVSYQDLLEAVGG